MVDYDLVILGGTLAGRHAAQVAAALDARVALIEPHVQMIEAELYRPAFVSASQRFHQAPEYNWMQQQLRTTVDSLMELRSHASLIATGVDIITGVPEFVPSPRLSVLVNHSPAAIQASQSDDPVPLLRSPDQGRVLRSRAYLIADGGQAFIPDVPGLATVPHLTLDTLPQLMQQSHPQSVIILGDDPSGLELAQAFVNLGSQVTLLTSQLPILHREDREIAQAYQAWLEADGIQIMPMTAIQSIQPAQPIQTEQPQVQVNLHPDWLAQMTTGGLAADKSAHDRPESTHLLATQAVQTVPNLDTATTLQADILIVAAGQRPDFSGIAPIMKLRRRHHRLVVSPQLRTTHRRIYACGAALGGYMLPHVAQYEAELAVRNALFFSNHSVNYWGIPYAIATRPALVRVGLTEQQARQRYGEDVWVFCQSLAEREQVRSQPSIGMVKLITHRRGFVLGLHVIGIDAQEAVTAIALAMRQGITVAQMAQIPNLPFTWGSLLSQLAQQWQARRDHANWRRELRETWFSFRRSWTR
ncbi:MAG: FAD-dependent oxidoreductase [Thainema sp.]